MSEITSENKKPTDNEICTYLSFLQGIIARMNANSMQCKLVCITLCAGLLAVYASMRGQNTCLILLLMVIVQMIFAYLDARYLAMEKFFRKQYEENVENFQAGELSRSKIFNIASPSPDFSCVEFMEALRSWSVWPVYALLLGAVFVLAAVKM